MRFTANALVTETASVPRLPEAARTPFQEISQRLYHPESVLTAGVPYEETASAGRGPSTAPRRELDVLQGLMAFGLQEPRPRASTYVAPLHNPIEVPSVRQSRCARRSGPEDEMR
jgi:hypothetical protein